MQASCKEQGLCMCQGVDIPQANPCHDSIDDGTEHDNPSEDAQQLQPPPTVFDDLDLARPVIPEDGTSPCLGEVQA